MPDWQEYDEWWVVSKSASRKGVFHAGPDCDAIRQPKSVVERSANYMQYHTPAPCPDCHEDIEATKPDMDDARTPLRELVKEDNDERL